VSEPVGSPLALPGTTALLGDGALQIRDLAASWGALLGQTTVATWSGVVSTNDYGEAGINFNGRLSRLDGCVVQGGFYAASLTDYELPDVFTWDYRADPGNPAGALLKAMAPHTGNAVKWLPAPVHLVAYGAGPAVALPGAADADPVHTFPDSLERLTMAADGALTTAGAVTLKAWAGNLTANGSWQTVTVPGLSRVDGAVMSIGLNGAMIEVANGFESGQSNTGGVIPAGGLRYRIRQSRYITYYVEPKPPPPQIALRNSPWGATPLWMPGLANSNYPGIPAAATVGGVALAWGAV
jgi:hypothetical protein